MSPEVCADDGGAQLAALERPIHHAGQELHGHVLEGQRRSVEELEQPLIGIELLERRDRGMAEGAIGSLDHRFQIGFRHRIAGEFLDHREGHFRIGPAAQGQKLALREFRPFGGHVKSAIAGEAGQQHILEFEFRGFTTGRNITQSGEILL